MDQNQINEYKKEQREQEVNDAGGEWGSDASSDVSNDSFIYIAKDQSSLINRSQS